MTRNEILAIRERTLAMIAQRGLSMRPLSDDQRRRAQEAIERKSADPVDHAAEIARLRADNERLRAALKPFAYYYDLNDCVEHDLRAALEVPISDLAAAKAALDEQSTAEAKP